MVREVAPVGRVEERDVGAVTGREPADPVGASEHVSRVDRAGGEGLRRGQMELRRRERADERQALTEGTARVEVGGERDRGPGIDERSRGRHRPVEEECARGQEHPDHLARRERSDPLPASCLQMVDRAGCELDGEWNRAGLRELVAVEPQYEPGVAARLEIPPRLRRVEGSTLEEHVRRLRELGRCGQDFGEREVEVGVGVAELRRYRVRAEPRREAARLPDRAERRELRLPVEPIARLRLEGRRALAEHPRAVQLDRCSQAVLACRPRSADRREDAAAGGMKLLVARPAGAERELVRAVAAERGMRVAVDKARDRAQPAAVELRDVTVERRHVAHPPDGLDRVAGAENERVLEHLDLAERRSAQRSIGSGGRRQLREVAQEQTRAGRRHASPGTGWLGARPAKPPAPGRETCPPSAAMGIRSPPSSAAASASG